MSHKSNFLIEVAVVNCNEAMEADTISKNGRNPKSQMSRRYLKMRKLNCFIIALSLLLCFQTTKAQINLEHTFDGTVTWNGGLYTESNLFPADCYYNTSTNDNSFIVKIYNADYSVNTSNTYNFTPPTNYKIYTVSMSREIFNTDGLYEFLVIYQRTDNIYDNTRNKAILYNQNGSIIKDFGSAYSIYAYPYLHIANNQFRLFVTKTYYDGSTTSQKSEIYSVPGTPPSGVSSQKTFEIQPPYPNPANTTITLPYQLKQGEMSVMRIYNLNGQLIETKQIDFVFNNILLNVSGYTKGVYFYEVNGVSNKFIVN